MAASFKGHVDVVRMLIKAFADVHSQNKVHNTAQGLYDSHINM